MRSSDRNSDKSNRSNKSSHSRMEGVQLPQDFVTRIKHQLGESSADFLAEYNRERVYGLRYNPLKIEKERFIELLSAHGIALEAVEWAQEGFYYPPGTQPGKLPLHEAGAYYIQEPSAMIAVQMLEPAPGDRVLDLCAAPGGKSTQAAGKMRGQGLLVSNEIVPARAKVLSRNIERMGISNAVVCNEEPERLAARFPAFFDKILVDAPCSGEGMFRKDTDARGEWSLARVEACAERQRGILAQAAGMLRPGGILVYSTCTFAPQENEEMADWFVQEFPQFLLERSAHIWPHEKRGEGHYAARFQKAGEAWTGSGHDSRDGTCMDRQDGFAAQRDRHAGKHKESRYVEKCKGSRRAGKRKDGGQDSQSIICTDRHDNFAAQVDRNAGKRKDGRYAERCKDSRRVEKCRDSTAAAAVSAWMDFCEDVLSEDAAAWLNEKIRMGNLAVFGSQLYLQPPGIGSLDGLKVERAGLQLGCLKKNRFVPSQALAMALAPEDVRRVQQLEEPERYLRGETISCSGQAGWTLVAVDGCSLGWGRVSQGILKNHYPKGLRI